MKRVSIMDIARASGYSKTAVSFAFNQPHRISAEARASILEIAERLGYIPDPLARNLSRKSSDTIGLLLPQPVEQAFANPYLVEIVRGIGKECHLREKILSLIPPVKGRLPEVAGEAAVDGMITIGLDPDAGVIEAMRKRNLPLVSIDADPLDDIPSVGIDDRAAAFAGMSRILELGHRNIAVLGLRAPDPPASYRYGGLHARRLEGINEAFEAYKRKLKGGIGELLWRYCEPTTPAGREAAETMAGESGWKGPDALTAIFAFSDSVAAGLLLRFRELGIDVPGRISILGFDGTSSSSLVSPRLSTIYQPGEEKGAKAAGALFELMEGGRPDSIVLPFSLIEGGSLAPPPVLQG